MKILFLDIDGVLNSDEFFAKVQDPLILPSSDHLDPAAIAVCNEILEKAGPNIWVVISSSWRKFFAEEELKRILCEKNGLKARIMGQTPRYFSHMSRGGEIRSFLYNYYRDFGKNAETIEGIVCLDDANDMSEMEPWTVQTTWEEGLQPKHVELALEILNKPMWTGRQADPQPETSPENE